jgi:class 3 adenylate cyclase
MQWGDNETAIKIFEALLSREPDNPATQNNYGVALLRAGKLPQAQELFAKAFETDNKREPEQAKKWPAYKNLMLLKGAEAFPGRTEIAAAPSYHNILFMDIVGFSRPSWYGRIQVEKITYLTDTVRTLLGELGVNFMEIPMLPTGDGMALLFENVEHPIGFAIELTKRLDKYNENQGADKKLELRIGIHSGDSFQVKDLHLRGNRCGPAINTARRVLDLGQTRQVLCTFEYGERLKLLFGPTYEPLLHDCGKYTVKHGEEIHIYNIYGVTFGNSMCPRRNTS